MASMVASLEDIRRAARRGRSVDQRWMLGVAVLWPGIIFVIVWLVSGAGRNDVAIVVLWCGSIGTLAVLAYTAQAAYRCPLRIRVACSAVAIAAVTALGYWTISGGLSVTKLRLSESSWRQSLKAVDDGRSIQG